MQKALFFTLLLTAAVLTASENETGPLEPQVPPWQHLWEGLEPVDQGQSDGTSFIFQSPEPNYALQGGGAATPSEFDDPGWQQSPRDWGNDVLVGQPAYENSGRISVDNDDETNDIFVCMLQNASEEDTGHVWRSTDGGVTWQESEDIVGRSEVGHISDAQILCGHDTAGKTWLYTVSAASNLGLRIRIMSPDMAICHWVVIDAATNIVRVAIDRNTENPEHLFCVWEDSDGDIRAMSSTDAGETWAHPQYITSGRRDVSFAAGGDGYGYVSYMDATDSTFVRVARFKDNLVNPQWSFLTVDSNPDFHHRDWSIAAARTSPGTSQVAIALGGCHYEFTNTIGPRYAYTQNGGDSWMSSFWPVTNQPRSTWCALFPRIRVSYDSPLFRAIVSMRETTTNWDTIVYARTTSDDPTDWVDRGEYNDHRNTGEVSHDVGYAGLGGFFVYRQFGQGEVWFDGFSLNGIDGTPTPVQPHGMIAVFGGEADVTLAKRSRVSASLYDPNGRLVRELVCGTLGAGKHMLNPGVANRVCFLRVTIDGRIETAKLVRLQ